MLSKKVRTEIILMFGENGRSIISTHRAFVQKFPNYANITITTVSNLVNEFLVTGSIEDFPKSGRPESVINNDNQTKCLAAIACSPNKPYSTRKLAQEVGISHTSVHRILKTNKYHPYKTHILQGLHGDDMDRRLEFCEWVLQQSTDISKKIIF